MDLYVFNLRVVIVRRLITREIERVVPDCPANGHPKGHAVHVTALIVAECSQLTRIQICTRLGRGSRPLRANLPRSDACQGRNRI